MGYWKWLYHKIKDIEKKQLEALWLFIKTVGGTLLIMMTIILVSSYFINNVILFVIVSMVSGLFFSLTWVIYNIDT